MAYKDRYGSTDIRTGRIDNLSIGWDYEDNPEDVKQRKPVFLFTPDMKDTNTHYHIELDRRQARKLRDWLTSYLNNEPTKHKKGRK